MHDLPATDRTRADRPHRRPRRHERRRQDGQADGVPGRAGAAARAQGARPRRAGRRAAEPLARARHERRSARRHARSSSPTPTAAARRNVEHNANSLIWAIDNWIYTSEHDGYLRLEGRPVRSAADAVARPVGRDDGRRRPHLPQHERGGAVRRSGAGALLHAAIRVCCGRAAATNRSTTATSVNAVWPVRPTPGVNRGYQDGVAARRRHARALHGGRRADGVSRRSAAGGSARQRLHRRARRQSGRPAHRQRRRHDGCTARKAYEKAEFLASTDERFRPVYLSSAPDGTLYVVDMYRGIIQHRGLHHGIPARSHRRRTSSSSRSATAASIASCTRRRSATRKPALSAATPARAGATLLAHPNGWWRDTAQRLLVERGDSTVVPALRQRACAARADVRDAAARAVDARRPRRHRAGDS